MKPAERSAPIFGGLPHWFQTGVYGVLFGVFGLWLLAVLDDVKARAERQEVALLIRNIRTGMQLAQGEAMIKQRSQDIAAWAGENPVIWLGSAPRGYVGVCSHSEALPERAWCFEAEKKELVYRPENPAHLRAEAAGVGGALCRDLRWRVVRVGDPARGSVGLRIEPATACRWAVSDY